jgi:hypothetical protein
MRTPLLITGVFVSLLVAAPVGRGQSRSALDPSVAVVDRANLEAREPTEAYRLFTQGRDLMEHGQPSGGCELLKRSLGLAKTVGTLLNLGLCHYQAAKLATALQYYREAESLAASLDDEERVVVARSQVAEIEPRVGSLTVSVIEQSNTALELYVDAERQPRESWGLPIRVDAGEHSIDARSPGRRPFHDEVTTRDGVQRLVIVPVLGVEAVPNAEAPPLAVPRSDVAEPESRRVQRTFAVVVGAAGLLALGTGAVFAVLAASADSASDTHCSAKDTCYPRGESLREEAHAHATRATVLMTAGGVALGTGAVLWIALPSERSASGSEKGARRLGAMVGDRTFGVRVEGML